ncbi:MAG: hypothetical protein AMXMBFR61_02120 [Fimbriimonadales bacterium]
MITRTEIEDLFRSQLQRIENEELRRKVVDTWLLACKRGNWNSIEDVRNMPFTLLVDAEGINFIQHTIAVTEGAVALAEAQRRAYDKMPYHVDMDRLIAGGLVHDVGKLLEIEPDGQGGYRMSHTGRCARHPISGAWLAAVVGLPEEIINIIVCHSKEGDGRPQVVETIFIHQADFAAFDPFVFRKAGRLIE